jgi:DivIVA domain-containing protein
MALSPEDILAKRFQVTKFREGYDQDEVDDYLDEVVVELRKILAENEEYKTRASLPQDSAIAVEPFPTAVDPQPTGEGADASRSIIELAQKLHADHVQEGRVKREQIIREAQKQAARILRDAEAQARETLNQLELDRRTVEESIEDLKRFEAEYRAKLRDYIQGQLESILSEEAYLKIDEEVSPVSEANVEMDYYSRDPMPLGQYQETELRAYSYSAYEEPQDEKPNESEDKRY